MMTRLAALSLSVIAFCSLPASAQPQQGSVDADGAVWLRPKPLPEGLTPRTNLALCGGWVGFYGPIDYRSASQGVRSRVERFHFDAYIQQYLAWLPGQPFDKYIAQNFAYTLRAFPNHPTAMLTMDQISRRLGHDQIPGGDYPMECWYLRAFQTVPDDPMVPALYGVYLAHRNRAQEAAGHLAMGEKGLCTHRVLQYHIGQAYARIGDWGGAQRAAMRAERLGFPLTALREQIVAAKRWDDALKLPEGPQMDCGVDEPAGAAPAAAPASTASN